ncbi:hypothetical protein ACSNOJ_19585 [Streptomyces sp. URMC 128]|uniref:hypothetical protein n=1 Tax=Streptomyces sp. URMC 128 TaxID=3423404 RepID=UPI003F1D49E7
MANIFSGGGRELDLSNGGTEAFVEVLMLAVSDLASEAWDLRFAALLILQDQNVMGRGAVGFHLEEVDWGASESERARSKDFVLRATALAASGHRWSELGYHPPRVHDYWINSESWWNISPRRPAAALTTTSRGRTARRWHRAHVTASSARSRIGKAASCVTSPDSCRGRVDPALVPLRCVLTEPGRRAMSAADG